MLSACSQSREKCLVINGRSFDVIGFAADRSNLSAIKQLCAELKLAAGWRSAVRAFERGEGQFLVMFADAAAYDAGVPSVMVAEDKNAFERSIHRAVSGVLGCKFLWNTCLDEEHEANLKRVLYVDTHLCGTC